MHKRKCCQTATNRCLVQLPGQSLPFFGGEPAIDDPHDAINQELLGI